MTNDKTLNNQEENEYKSSNYELFILFLSILSIFNIFFAIFVRDPNLFAVIFSVDLILSFIFMADFLYRLFTANSKRQYFLKEWGWLDLLSSLPITQAKIARLARIFRAIRLMRQFGLRSMIRATFQDRASSSLFLVITLVILVFEFGSLAVLFVEEFAPGANITTANDAMWWSVVTMSTVGYGDQFPVTPTGRLIGILVITVGIGLFGVITGFLANVFLGDDEKIDDKSLATDNILTLLQEIKISQLSQEKVSGELNNRLAALEVFLRSQGGETS